MNKVATAASRVLSIDVFRGITIFTMVFVNELAGIKDIPTWMKHLPADVDGMTFVDLVFPAFLFIVGMSIPFAIQARVNKGDSSLEIFKHVLIRSVSLIVIGIFMVNAESGYDKSQMNISISLWTLLMFIAVLLIWSHYPKSWSEKTILAVKALGVIILASLWLLYKGPNDTGMTTQWWGILGLIGWAYLIAATIFILAQKAPSAYAQLAVLVFSALALLVIYFGFNITKPDSIPILNQLAANNGNHTHAAIVLAGAILSSLFYHPVLALAKTRNVVIFCMVLAALAIASWQFSPISKIWATPSWALFSVLACSLIFGFIYWLVDIQQKSAWCKLFEPAATNPLLVYILPYILISILGILGISLRPDIFNSGVAGILWCLVFTCVIMLIGAGLTRMGLRLKL